MSSFCTTATITGQATYPTSPQIDLSALFEPIGWSLRAHAGGSDADIAYSLDGVNDHGFLVEGQSSNPQSFAGKERKVWLRVRGGTGAVTVVVQAKN